MILAHTFRPTIIWRALLDKLAEAQWTLLSEYGIIDLLDEVLGVSDTTEPNPSDNLPYDADPETSIVSDAPVPHSGNLGLEQPVKDFDNTSLEEALSQGLVETPDDPSPIEESEPVSNIAGQSYESNPRGRRWLVPVIGAGLAAAAFLGFKAGEDSGSPQSKVPTATAPGETPKTSTPEISASAVGNIDILHLKDGEDYISVTRETGEIIKVPYLRASDTPTELAESAFALISCYLSTGNQECLDALSPHSVIQDYMRQWRNSDFVRSEETVQAVFYDERNFPVEFEYGADEDGNKTIHMKPGGELIYGVHGGELGKSKWQSSEVRDPDNALQYLVKNFDMKFRLVGDRGIQLVALDWELY